MSLYNTLRYITRHPMNRGKCGAALRRFLRWQVASRLFPSAAFVFPWVNGVRLIARRGETGVTGNLYCGLHEFEDMALTRHLLRPGDLFVDVGANSGSYTLLACGSAGADGIAIEPVPSTFERLCDSIALNQLQKRVQTLNTAVGDSSGTIRFTLQRDTTNHAATQTESTSEPTVIVPVQKLDEICVERVPQLIKIDVEGYERFVLAGGNETLGRPELQAVIMEVNGSGNRYGRSDSELLESMAAFGFCRMSYDPLHRSLFEAGAPLRSDGNVLFVRNADFVKMRTVNAQRFQVFDCLL